MPTKPVPQSSSTARNLARQRALFWSLAFAFVIGVLTWQLQGAQAGAAGGLVSAETGPFMLGEGFDEPTPSLDLDVDDPPPLTLSPIFAFRYVPFLGDTCDHCRSLRANPHPARAPPSIIA
ncbi:MAG: hypothetical protein HWE39_06340 [Oceanospirillaceae bacterium]|nr:hypothetical protein [Oceanospirillaceae bacterium]